jgi:hypothetical protein
VDGNDFTGTGPVHTSPTLVPELADNTFSSSETAVIYLDGTVGSDTALPVIGAATQYNLENHISVSSGATLTVDPGVEIYSQGYGYSGEGYELRVYGTLSATGVTFTNRTELFARDGGRIVLSDCDISGSWVQYDAGSSGSVTGSTFGSAYLRLSSPSVAVDNNTFTGTDPVHTTPVLVPELFDNIFNAADTATVYLSGTVGRDTSLEPIGAVTRYSLENHVTVAAGATLAIEPGLELHTQGYGYSGEGYELNTYGALHASGVTFTNRTELFARDGGQLVLADCDVSGRWVQYDAGGSGSVTGSTFGSAYLRLSSLSVAVDNNTLTGTNPVYTTAALVPELFDNTFDAADTATIYLSGTVGRDTSLEPIGAVTRYSLENHVAVATGATLSIEPGVELHTQGYGYSGEGFELQVYGALDASGVTFTNRSELFALAGGRVMLTDCDVSGRWVQADAGSSGSITGSTFSSAYLRLNSPSH